MKEAERKSFDLGQVHNNFANEVVGVCDFLNETKFAFSCNLIAGVYHLNLTLGLNQF